MWLVEFNGYFSGFHSNSLEKENGDLPALFFFLPRHRDIHRGSSCGLFFLFCSEEIKVVYRNGIG